MVGGGGGRGGVRCRFGSDASWGGKGGRGGGGGGGVLALDDGGIAGMSDLCSCGE